MENDQVIVGGSDWFHSMVPPEVLETIIHFLDFRSTLLILPKVCSPWRQFIIQHIHTLHIYPHVDLYGGDLDHLFINSSNEKEELYQKHMMIEKDMIPFVKYLTAFVKQNQMKIRQLFIYGNLREANLDRYVPSRPARRTVSNTFNGNFEFPSIGQQKKQEFKKRLMEQSSGNYFPNFYTEPAFSNELLANANSYINLDFSLDSNAFCNLLQACQHSLQTLVLKSCRVNHAFCATLDLVKDKLENLVLDSVSGFYCNNAQFENLKYFYNDTETNCISSSVMESLHVGSRITVDMKMLSGSSCKKLSVHLDYSKMAQINRMDSSVLLNNNNIEELEISLGSVKHSYWDYSLSNIDTVEMVKELIELLTNFTKLKKLTIILESSYDTALLNCKSSPIFLIEDENLQKLPNVLEVKLEGRFFFAHRVDNLLKHFPNLLSLSCQVTNSSDAEWLNSLVSLKFLERLDLSILSSSWTTVGSKVMESLVHVFRTRDNSPLKALCLRGYNSHESSELDQLLEALLNCSSNNNNNKQRIKLYLIPGGASGSSGDISPLQDLSRKYERKIDLQVLESAPIVVDQSLIDVEPIDYSQSPNEIIEERRKLSKKLQHSNIICLFCGCQVKRCDYEKHNLHCHSGNEVEYALKVSKQLDLTNYETHCQACHQDVKRKDFPSHPCSEVAVKLPIKLPFDNDLSEVEPYRIIKKYEMKP